MLTQLQATLSYKVLPKQRRQMSSTLLRLFFLIFFELRTGRLRHRICEYSQLEHVGVLYGFFNAYETKVQ